MFFVISPQPYVMMFFVILSPKGNHNIFMRMEMGGDINENILTTPTL
jgi:hypothetical protein